MMRYNVIVELFAGGLLNGSQLQKALDCDINDILEFVDDEAE